MDNKSGNKPLAIFSLVLGIAVILSQSAPVPASAQTTSIARQFAKYRVNRAESPDDPRNLRLHRGNPTLERNSLIAVKAQPPRQFKVHDLITIIIREQRKFEADGELESKKQYDLKSEIEALFNPIHGTLGAATFSNGKPNVDVSVKSRLKNESDKEREDKFTTRITGEVIDIKPNGNLVIQATAHMAFDRENSTVSLTGVARSQDISPDNSVLSTLLADKVIDVRNSGAVHDGSRRGWVTRLVDALSPI